MKSASKLTPREIEILNLVAPGKRQKAIAYELDISPHTVKNTLANISHKLSLSGAINIVNYARSVGVIA